MSNKLELACLGKSKSKGGLNMSDLKKASRNPNKHRMKRIELLAELCPGRSPVNPAQASPLIAQAPGAQAKLIHYSLVEYDNYREDDDNRRTFDLEWFGVTTEFETLMKKLENVEFPYYASFGFNMDLKFDSLYDFKLYMTVRDLSEAEVLLFESLSNKTIPNNSAIRNVLGVPFSWPE